MIKNLRKASLLVSAAAIFAGMSHAVIAQEILAMPSEGMMKALSEGKAAPALQYLIDNKVKLTYLGDAGGMPSYLGESPSGTTQTFYLTPDGEHVIAGVMFRKGGINVTGVQITEMQRRYEDAKVAAEKAGAAFGSVDAVEGPKLELPLEMPVYSPTDIQVGKAVVQKSADYLSHRDVENFKSHLESTAWFSIGAPTAPPVYMVADPNCPFCHALWRDLRPMIMSQEISLRVIMIAGLVNSEADAISILSRQDPGQAWFAGEGSERTMPVAAPPQKDSEAYKNGYRYLERNMVFIEKMGVVGTPHLFYFDAEGALYESAGIPENRSAFFGSLTE